jgi:hypothetical protein
MRSSPVIRARIYSYLYYGLKRFNMHTVVDIIPLLLHASLLFFFGGLVAFLIPINTVIAAIAAVLLGAVVAVYSLLTLLPLWSLDCPYRTPLSTAVWRISQKLMDIWRRRHREPDVVLNTSETETMAEAMAHRAMEVSPARTTRDYRALVWTVKSLADDVELEPFVEALPDLLWAPNGRRYTYENHIQKLIRAPELQLQFRIEALLQSCDGGLLTPEAARRRRITCYKALWAMASVQPPPTSSIHLETLDFSRMVDYCRNQSWRKEPEELHYSLSAEAMLRWSTFCSLKSQLATLVNYLVRCRTDGCTPDLQSVKSGMRVRLVIFLLFRTADKLNEHVSHLTAASVPDLIRAIDEFCIMTPHEILINYLAHSVSLESQPYQHHHTQYEISQILESAPFSAFVYLLVPALNSLVHRNFDGLTPAWNWIDTIVRKLCSYWRPDEPMRIPDGIICYFNSRNSKYILAQLSFDFGAFLWSSFPITLSLGHSRQVVQAMWCLAWVDSDMHSPTVYEPVLKELEATSDSSPLTFSVTIMVKSRLLSSLLSSYEPLGGPPLRHLLLPTETTMPIPPEFLDAKIADNLPDFEEVLGNRIGEAKVVLVADFLNGFRSDFIPYKAAETLRYICDAVPVLRTGVHPNHQNQFASGMRCILDSDHQDGMELLNAIIESNIFEAYFEAAQPRMPQNVLDHASLQDLSQNVPGYAWLQDLSARGQIINTLTASGSMQKSMRFQAILDGIESLHPSS